MDYAGLVHSQGWTRGEMNYVQNEGWECLNAELGFIWKSDQKKDFDFFLGGGVEIES